MPGPPGIPPDLGGRGNDRSTEDVATRFIGYGWNVTRVGDANDLEMLTRAFEVFHRERGRPTPSPSGCPGCSAARPTVIGMRTFGASAPLKALAAEFGFTPDAVVRAARERIAAVAADQAAKG
jgi:transketolase